MKKILLFLCSIFLYSNTVFSSESCFLAKENGKVLMSEGSCEMSYSPCSTFKIPLALMGFDAGLLTDELHPEMPFKEEYEAYLETWKLPQTPTSWMKYSCVWYSQILTPKLGKEKFQNYVQKFNYGNQDLSGDYGLKNGLTNSWLSSSLEISPNEQLAFLEKLLDNKLPVTAHAHQMTKNVLYVDELAKGWKLYGKTGSGYLLNKDKTKKLDVKHGWFIGWIEKVNNKIIFVNHIVDDKVETDHAGPRARTEAKEKLIELINEIEK